jgi:hypothetical protein
MYGSQLVYLRRTMRGYTLKVVFSGLYKSRVYLLSRGVAENTQGMEHRLLIIFMLLYR